MEQQTAAILLRGVDTHAHVFHPGLAMDPQRRYTPAYAATVDEYLENLAQSGLSHGVLVQPSFLGTDNSHMLDALRLHPEKLRGIAVVDPDISDGQLDFLGRCGVVGIRLNLVGIELHDRSLNPWSKLFGKLKERGWLIEIQRQSKDLKSILGQLLPSGVRVVIDHFGLPDAQLGVSDPGFCDLLSMPDSGRIWVKISAAYRSGKGPDHTVAMTQALCDRFGADHLLWGSDWPNTQFESQTNYAHEYSLLEPRIPDPALRRKILVDTPASLFGFR